MNELPDSYAKFAKMNGQAHMLPKVNRLKEEIKRLSHAYTKNLTKEQLDTYADILSNYELKDVMEAINIFIRDPDRSTYFPSAAKVVEAVKIAKGQSLSKRAENIKDCFTCRNVGAIEKTIVDKSTGIPYRYGFRCSCKAGENYSGLPFFRRYD